MSEQTKNLVIGGFFVYSNYMKTEIIMYGADWCGDCVRSKEILEERNINYTMRDITDSEKGEEYSETVMNINNGKRIIPTFVIGDDHYANPRPSDLNTILDNLEENEDNEITKCSNGKVLENGNTIILTRDLNVKGSQLNLKQGTSIEKIKLTGDPAYVDARIGKSTISIKTEYVKKKG